MSSRQPNLDLIQAQTNSMSLNQKQALIAHFKTFITAERAAKMDRVIAERTRHITVVLEDIYQNHNASAVLRSCDCFGVQDVHIIENRNAFSPNSGVSIGAHQWLNIYRARQIAEGTKIDRFAPVTYSQPYLRQLKEQGFRLIATTPHQPTTTLQKVSLNQPIALLFGSEQQGLSSEALQLADERMVIPMYGFSESFNISVTVALCLHTLSQKLRESNQPWQLSEQEQTDTLLQWLTRTISGSEQILTQYLKI